LGILELFSQPSQIHAYLTFHNRDRLANRHARSCSSFATQAEAQDYFNRTQDGRLDRDKDGIACENLPGGASAPRSAIPDRPLSTSTQCSPYIPKVNPWKLPKAVLMGDNAKTAYYYNNVVLAGDLRLVSEFLDCYGLTVKYTPGYASANPVWAACTEVGIAGEGGQIVCVAVDENGKEADERIFSAEYAEKVAKTLFGN
jgi:Excalibur calcium-binding domain